MKAQRPFHPKPLVNSPVCVQAGPAPQNADSVFRSYNAMVNVPRGTSNTILISATFEAAKPVRSSCRVSLRTLVNDPD